MQAVITFLQTPQGRDVLASLGILIASEIHGWGKGGSLVQTAMGLFARFCTKYSTPAHQALVAEVLKVQGVADITADPAEAGTPQS